jgi:hypothetical protein
MAHCVSWSGSAYRSAEGLPDRGQAPQWMVFTPGIAPVVADAAAYVGIIIVGHAVMRFVADAAQKDRLAQRPKYHIDLIAYKVH